MVTEFVEGGELFEEIGRRKNFTEKIAADIMKQLLSAIIYCHKRGIAHRDLKLENILLVKSDDEDSFHIKVIDFGTAELFDSYTKFRNSAGTIYYIAPEVIMNCYDEKCDIWSCGVILYTLLSGSPPFNGQTPEAILEAISTTKFNFDRIIHMRTIGPIWEGISDDAKNLIKNMIKYPPEDRFNAQQAYSHRWIRGKAQSSVQPEVVEQLISNMKQFKV